MSPATRRIVIPLIVTVVALSVVAVGIVGKRNATDPAKTTPEPPTEVADASSETAAAPSTATPEAADAPGADPASDVSPAIDPVALAGLRAVARGGPFGHETPPAMMGSLEPGDDARMQVEFSRAGAGIAKITLSDVWISADARRQADRYLAAVAAGIGNFAAGGLSGIGVGSLLALIGWYVWAYLCYAIGTHFLGEAHTRATPAELLRTLGFASAPGMLRILGFNSSLFIPVHVVAGIWMLVAMVIAVQQTFAFSTPWRAIAVCVTGQMIQVLLILLMVALFGGSLTP